MDFGRLQVLIAGTTLVAGLVGVYASLNARITTLERQVETLEKAVAHERNIMTGEIIELLKVVHQMRGQMPPVATDARGPR